MIDFVKRLLGAKPVQEAQAYVERARESVTRAGQEAGAAVDAVTARAAELAGVEAEYDASPSEGNGRAVIKARDALALAKLRQDRAERRAGEAGEQLRAAETELERVTAAEELRQARERATDAITGERGAGREVKSILDEALRRCRAVGLDARRQERVTALAELADIERKMELAADHGATEARASWQHASDEAAPAVALLLAAEELTRAAREMAEASLDQQRAAAAVIGAEPFPDAYLEAMLVRARFTALPDAPTPAAEEKTARAVVSLLRYGHEGSHYDLGAPAHMTLAEWADLLLAHPLREAREIAAKSAPPPYVPPAPPPGRHDALDQGIIRAGDAS